MFLIHRASKIHGDTYFQTTDLLCSRMVICVQQTLLLLLQVLSRLLQSLIGSRQVGIQITGRTAKPDSRHHIVRNGVAGSISFWTHIRMLWRHSIFTRAHSVDFEFFLLLGRKPSYDSMPIYQILQVCWQKTTDVISRLFGKCKLNSSRNKEINFRYIVACA
jgi:hypothetical protein